LDPAEDQIAMKAAVLGLGNILLQDEGIGVRVVQELWRRYDLPPGVEFVDGGTSAMDLLEFMAGRDLVILVDAVRAGRAPSSVVRLVGDDIGALFRQRISPHQLGIAEVLATLLILGEAPKTVVLLGIEPKSMSVGLGLSPELSRIVASVVAQVVTELRAVGMEPEIRSVLASKRASVNTPAAGSV